MSYKVGDFVRMLCGRFTDQVGQIVCMKPCPHQTGAYGYTLAFGNERLYTYDLDFEPYVPSAPPYLGG